MSDRLLDLMFSCDPRTNAQEHELIDMLADIRGTSDEQRGAEHWRADNPPAVGSEAWVQEQAETYLLIEQARRDSEREYQEVCARGASS